METISFAKPHEAEMAPRTANPVGIVLMVFFADF
jgi:hypothetical protein